MKRLLPIIIVSIFMLLLNCTAARAENWIPSRSYTNVQWYWDGDSAWFDPLSKNGGVNEKLVDESIPRSAIVNIKFHLGDEFADETYGYVHIYDASGNQVEMAYDGKQVRYRKGSLGYAYLRTVAHYAMDKNK